MTPCFLLAVLAVALSTHAGDGILGDGILDGEALDDGAVEGDVLDADVRAVAPRLVALMRDGLRRTEPTASVVRRAAGEALFDGSYDWHSNLFAHWALLTHARVEGDAELAAWLLAPLTDEALAAECARAAELDTKRLATYPYDQGWLLLLLAELERHPDPASPELRALRLEVEERLLAWLDASPFPENDDPEKLDGRRFVGWYRSWLFAWYQVRLSGPVGEDALARLRALKAERIAPHVTEIAELEESQRFEFLWMPALPWLVHDVDPFEEPPPAYALGVPPPLPESVKLSTVHVLGVEVSRLWPLAILARDGDAEARAALSARWGELIAREDLWAEDFEVVTHWVPQFLWFTLWLAEGRP